MKPGVLALTCLLLSSPAASWAQGPTLVLASRDDPYFVLAEEIALAENLRLVDELGAALAEDPEFLLWVVSPARLSDRELVDLGLAIDARRAAVSIGIISGSSIETARALWQRAGSVRGRRLFAVNGESATTPVVQGRIRSVDPDGIQPLTRGALVSTLRRADYLTFTGHGGAGYLSLAPRTVLTAGDIPDLPPVVVATGSCQTIRPWRPNSIALAFVDRGAAAYAGFVYSPNEGFLFGEFGGLPFRYTWHEFPIGHVMQVQTRGTLRGFAAFPYHVLLGDPRIALNEGPPYRVFADRKTGSDRILAFTDAPAGVLPIRISDGVLYRFVEVPGVASVGEDDLFYNSRLQMVDIGDAKYLLFKHDGGDFTMVLRREVPARHAVLIPLGDSLDAALVFGQQHGGDLAATVAGILVWLVIGWRAWRRRDAHDPAGHPGPLRLALCLGLGFALLHGLYAWLRVGHITINEKPTLSGPLSFIGTFLLVAGAGFLYLCARSWRGRAAAIVLAILPALGGAAVTAALMFIVNLASARQLGAGYYNYSLSLLYLTAAAIELPVVGTAFALSRRVFSSMSRGAA
jgi:hypothetical protein